MLNPILHWLASLLTGAALSRRCPACGQTQVVPRHRQGGAVGAVGTGQLSNRS